MLGSTRDLYEKKLKKVLQTDGHGQLNGAEKGVLYSDSEEEDDDAEPGIYIYIHRFFYLDLDVFHG